MIFCQLFHQQRLIKCCGFFPLLQRIPNTITLSYSSKQKLRIISWQEGELFLCDGNLHLWRQGWPAYCSYTSCQNNLDTSEMKL